MPKGVVARGGFAFPCVCSGTNARGSLKCLRHIYYPCSGTKKENDSALGPGIKLPLLGFKEKESMHSVGFNYSLSGTGEGP